MVPPAAGRGLAAVPGRSPRSRRGRRQSRLSVFVCLRPLARGRLRHSAPARLMEQLAAPGLIASPRAKAPGRSSVLPGCPRSGPRRLGGSWGSSAMRAAAAGLLPPPRPGAGEPWLRRSIRTASSIHYNNPLSKQSAGAAGTTRTRCKQSSGYAANDINKITINSSLTPARSPWESPGAASRG